MTTEPTWQRLARRTLHSGRMIVAEYDVAVNTGERTTFEVDESIPFAVAVLVSDGAGSVILARQYRFALDSWIFDLPGGAGGVGEDPASAAARECREETGLLPTELIPLHTVYPNPGRSAWPLHLYFCEATTSAERDVSDPAEQVAAVTMPVSDLDALIRDGAVVDPGLLVARLYAGLRGLLPPLT